MSSKKRLVCSVLGCSKQCQTIHKLPINEKTKAQWIFFIFDGNAPATFPKHLHVCGNHFTGDCYTNFAQFKAGHSTTLRLKEGAVPTIRAGLPAAEGVAVPCVAVQNTNNFPAVNTGNVTTVNTSSLPRVRHAATQTVPPSKRSVGIQLSMRKLKTNVRNAGTQATVVSKSRGVDTHTFSLDRLFLQPTLVKRPAKRPRLSISDKEEEEKDSPECS
ncbi:THAP domain-containing protein 10-like isoform X1 [Solea senegalensis]|uniref:THAP domain-containing protein 10-like isoform X1 n=1 Tax=Solea senegalensis TaxID=28829 RepID=A0AAV6PQ97_SOLSE|nr:uncharacterized protein LOC122774755 isoform X1 [Solea senegalensis]KAG7474847.1 THAP domain-containing protein 10-like isoform X1 [Solea senegalensis]